MDNVAAMAAAMIVLAACSEAPTSVSKSAVGRAQPARSANSPGIVEIVVRGHAFDAPSEIASGWTTIRLRNASSAEHFVVLERMPDGKTVADSRTEIVPVFQDALDHINAGRTAEGLAEFARLPAWYASIALLGGPGIVSPGHSAETSLYLEPGTYVIECYMKTGGRIHSADGMIEQPVVAGPGDGTEPRASFGVTLSNDGIAIEGVPRPGRRTIAVDLVEQRLHENSLGGDVHLARLEDDTDLDELDRWMNRSQIGALGTPAPVEFLGGTHEMPAGSRAYFTVLLKPGRFALISEVPNPASKGMLRTFTVPSGR